MKGGNNPPFFLVRPIYAKMDLASSGIVENFKNQTFHQR